MEYSSMRFEIIVGFSSGVVEFAPSEAAAVGAQSA